MPARLGPDVVWARRTRRGFGVYLDGPGERDRRIGMLPRLDDLPAGGEFGGLHAHTTRGSMRATGASPSSGTVATPTSTGRC